METMMIAEETNETLDSQPSTKEKSEPTESRKALVTRIIEDVKKAKQIYDTPKKGAFWRMRRDMEFARLGATKKWIDADKYVANLVQRHIKQKVSGLYAKNPTFRARPSHRMDFEIWDGKAESLQAAMQEMQQSQQMAQAASTMLSPMGIPPMPPMPSPQTMALLQDIQQGKQRRDMRAKVAKTLELLFKLTLNRQQPSFKTRAKQLVRRTATCGVGYIKLGFQREMGLTPDDKERLADYQQRVAHLESLSESLEDEMRDENSAEAEELRLAIEQLSVQDNVVEEGLVFDFPKSTAIIIDPRCVELKGFVGARWVAHEFLFTVDDIKEIYKVDISGKFSAANLEGRQDLVQKKFKGKDIASVWEFYDKLTGMVYTVCDGYDDFLEDPRLPGITLKRFFPIFALTFNDSEDENDIYPDSDVHLMRHQQLEHNRSRDALRQHRIANQPTYIAPRGVLEEADKNKLKSHEPHEIIEFKSMKPGVDSATIIQPMKKTGIDPNLYETSYVFDDMQRVIGSQEANFGSTSNATATEVSTAEGSRMSAESSNKDDLNDFLSELAEEAGRVLLREMSVETVKQLVGPGAVWPEFGKEEFEEEIMLEIVAGSSGRPNQAQEISNFERLAPWLVQTPNINPAWFAGEIIKRLDDGLEMEDVILDSMPSLTALNTMMSNSMGGGGGGQAQVSTGNPMTDPRQQAAQGMTNAPAPEEPSAGPYTPSSVDLQSQ